MCWNRIRQRGTGNLILAGILGGLVLVVAAPAVVGPGPRDGTLAAGQWPAGHASPHIVDAAFTMGDASIHINVDPNRTSGTDLDLEMIWAEAAEVGTLHFRHGDVLSGRIVAEHIYMEDGGWVYIEPGTEIIAAGDLYLGAALVPARPPDGSWPLSDNGDPDPLGPPCVPAEIEFDEDKDGNPTHPTNLPNVNWGDALPPTQDTGSDGASSGGISFQANQITVRWGVGGQGCIVGVSLDGDDQSGVSHQGGPGGPATADANDENDENDENEDSKDAIAIGGNGGNGGDVNLEGIPGPNGEESTIRFLQGAVICNAGGGKGGDAVAVGKTGRSCQPGGSAVARGGDGGNAGNITIEADHIHLWTRGGGQGALRRPRTPIQISPAGSGGQATATGGSGGDCGECEAMGGRGGDAFAQGGNAGAGATVTLTAKVFWASQGPHDPGAPLTNDNMLGIWLGNTHFHQGIQTPGAAGGQAEASSGRGGDATVDCDCNVAGIPGGDAGRACAMGGDGGSGHTITAERAAGAPLGDPGVMATRATHGGEGGEGFAESGSKGGDSENDAPDGGGDGRNSRNCKCHMQGAQAGGKGGDGALAEARGGKGGDANWPQTLTQVAWTQVGPGGESPTSGNGGFATAICRDGGDGGNGGGCFGPDVPPCQAAAGGDAGKKGEVIAIGGQPGNNLGRALQGENGGSDENPCGPGNPGIDGLYVCIPDFPWPCHYKFDSRTTTTAVGIPEPAVIMWLQKFEVFHGVDLITTIQSTFGSPTLPGIVGVSPGDPVGYVLYDVGSDGGPGNLLYHDFAVIEADAIATDQMQILFVPGVAVEGEFFVGVYVADPGEGFFPAPLDQSVAEPAENVWVAAHAVDIDAFDPGSDSAEWSLPPATLITFDIPGVWRLCASGLPDEAPPESCAGSCGGTAAAGCWCDQACVDLGDCCEDHCEQCPGTCCPWDVTSDGDVGPDDLFECTALVGPCPQDGPCPCDFNRDGVVDVLDLNILLEHFGDCP